MKKYVYILTIILILTMFGCGPNKESPEYIAKLYLTALKNKDWETAKKYSTREAGRNIEMMEALGSDFGITEIKDIKCRTREGQAICTFCCSNDTGFNKIYLKRQEHGQWLQDHPKIIEFWNF